MDSLKGIAALLRFVWWLSIVWLTLAVVVIVWFFIIWLGDSSNPARHEFGIPAAAAFLYSIPAIFGALLAGIVPKTGLSIYQRIGGIALMFFCLITVFTFDFLQARYR